jgi:NAD(P)-dependent dehydrogenase (short-subunit alcohol dehydrogenase family)
MAVSAPWLVLSGARSALGQAVAARWRARVGGPILGLSRYADVPCVTETVAVDLRVPTTAAGVLAAWAAERGAAVGGFVHAAGLVYAGSAAAMTWDEWRQTMAVNLEAGFWVARALLPAFTTPAAVVFVSSIDSGRQAADGPAAAYGAAKAGLEALARHLAAEWGPRGVRVNAVRLGPLTAGMHIQPEVRARLQGASSDGRLTTPEEAAVVVDWLLNPDSAAVTGQSLTVDHGLGLRY